MKNNRIKQLAVTLLSVMTLASMGTAAAAGYTQYVGGGTWKVTYTPGVQVTSEYYHPTVRHSASAQVGFGPIVHNIAPAGYYARASACGVGTTKAFWNNAL